MTVSATRRQYLEALAQLPERHKAWLRAGDIELFAYHGWGILLTSAQHEQLNEVLTWPPGTIHVWRWANRTGKTTGLDVLYAFATWYKWRYVNEDIDGWLAYPNYKVLHAAPLNELAGKAYELFENLIDGAADQQMNPLTNRVRPAVLRAFYQATKTVDVTGVDRPTVDVANGARIDFRSTQGGAARLESDSWWVIAWDEFPRQIPSESITEIFDQTLLPRSSDFMAPIVLAGTATIASEAIYSEVEDLSADNPSDWNFTSAARTSNFAQSRASIDRQLRLSIDKDVANRSVGGTFGQGGKGMFPAFLLDNAFRRTLPDEQDPPADEDGWAYRNDPLRQRTYVTSFDHALGGDDNVLMTFDVPWPPSTISPTNPVVGVHCKLIRASRSLTPSEQQAYLSAEVRRYRSKLAIIDSTGPGGLGVFRAAREAGLPALDCNLQGRAAKWVTNKEFALGGLQRLLCYGTEPIPGDEILDEFPLPAGPFGLIVFPAGGDWRKAKRQASIYKRADEKLRQDAWMTVVQFAWWLWKLVEHAKAPTKQPFNIMASRPRRFARR